ncbi:MAG: hypothetical protein BWY91_03023 [bacterium ADurb.BinA028]|nr:MAG: hypothetical protein BWY91_03023 [bacterium ADurb.BinA028]
MRSPSKTPMVLAAMSKLGRCQSAAMSASSMATLPVSANSTAAMTSKTARTSEGPSGREVSPSGSESEAAPAVAVWSFAGVTSSVMAPGSQARHDAVR